MEYKIQDLTNEQINILNKFNKDDLINVLQNLEKQKENRNIYHRTYYNKIKEDEQKINNIKDLRKEYYLNIKNDAVKYSLYLNKMKEYNKNHLIRLKLKNEQQDKPLKKVSKTLNYIVVCNDYYLININKFINNFQDLEILNKKIKQLFINKNDVISPFLIDGIFNEENIKKFVVSKYNNIIAEKFEIIKKFEIIERFDN
jgi:hypothetical protein